MLISLISINETKKIGYILKASRGHYSIGVYGMYGDFTGDYRTRHEAVEALKKAYEKNFPIIARPPETMDEVISVVKALYPWARWVTSCSTGPCVWELKPQYIGNGLVCWVGEHTGLDEPISWAIGAFLGMDPENSLIEIGERKNTLQHSI